MGTEVPIMIYLGNTVKVVYEKFIFEVSGFGNVLGIPVGLVETQAGEFEGVWVCGEDVCTFRISRTHSIMSYKMMYQNKSQISESRNKLVKQGWHKGMKVEFTQETQKDLPKRNKEHL